MRCRPIASLIGFPGHSSSYNVCIWPCSCSGSNPPFYRHRYLLISMIILNTVFPLSTRSTVCLDLRRFHRFEEPNQWRIRCPCRNLARFSVDSLLASWPGLFTRQRVIFMSHVRAIQQPHIATYHPVISDEEIYHHDTAVIGLATLTATN